MIVTFAKPGYLIYLAIVPLLVLLHFALIGRQKKRAMKFANFDAMSRVQGVELLSKNIFFLLLTSIVVALVVFSLADMTIQTVIPASSYSFIIALDTSRSMEATDYLPTRLEAAKQTAKDFIDSTPLGTKIGVISFSGNAFIEQSVTNDKELAKQAIDRISISSIGGTDLSEPIITGSNLLKGEDAKAIILLGDGQINVGTIADAIDYANKNNVLVHTIAIGTPAGGKTTYGISKADIDSLKALSFGTDGKFFNAVDKSALSSAYISVLHLQIKKVDISISNYLLLAALGVLVVEYFLFNARYKVLP